MYNLRNIVFEFEFVQTLFTWRHIMILTLLGTCSYPLLYFIYEKWTRPSVCVSCIVVDWSDDDNSSQSRDQDEEDNEDDDDDVKHGDESDELVCLL